MQINASKNAKKFQKKENNITPGLGAKSQSKNLFLKISSESDLIVVCTISGSFQIIECANANSQPPLSHGRK